MNITFTPPHQALLPYIKGYLYIELDVSDSTTPLDVHPMLYHAIGLNLNTQKVFANKDFDFGSRLGYHGHVCRHIPLRSAATSLKVIVVPFTATGAYQLFKIPQHELLNKIFPVKDVIPRANTLKNQLEEDLSCEKQATSLIEQWLLQQIPSQGYNYHAPKIDYACHLIQQHSGGMRIKDLCREAGVSQTYLEDHFKEMVGISPKLYSRISRFIAAHQFVLQNTSLTWGEVIYRYGFFDQSHFIREFKTFFGYTPSEIYSANSQIAQSITQKLSTAP